jgi:hypothetical protein
MAIHGLDSDHYLLKSNKLTESYSSKMFIVNFKQKSFFKSFLFILKRDRDRRVQKRPHQNAQGSWSQ